MYQMRFLKTFFLSTSFLLFGILGLAQAAGRPVEPDQWVLGDYLLAGALFLIVIAFLTGAYALLFSNSRPLIKRAFLYPLFKVIGMEGEKKPLITKK
ncbi:MAG: hypothetical protein HY282_03705 [Nitrospirae bacterium]|nr:hypothetical protein [Candidatus Manganitrophaceae bacterium]